MMLTLCMLLSVSGVKAQTINFDDALADNAHGYDPAIYYIGLGLTISGSYSGVIEGVSNGDQGNFKLESTNGPASLAAVSITSVGESINLSFTTTKQSICFDLGAAYFNPTQTPVPLSIRVKRFLNGIQKSSVVVGVEDTLKNGMGTWYTQGFINIDRVNLESVSGNGTWAIDKLRINQPCEVADNSLFFPIVTPNGKIAVIYL